MNLRLRPFRVSDERAARAAHIELSEEDLPFLLGWEPDQPWTAYVQRLASYRQGVDVDLGWVPATFLAADLAGVLVGRVSIRHELNEFLENFGGHIGYAVCPTYRDRGIATEILRQALVITRGEGIDEVLLTCDEDHVVSAHIIERRAGRTGYAPSWLLAGKSCAGPKRPKLLGVPSRDQSLVGDPQALAQPLAEGQLPGETVRRPANRATAPWRSS